MLDDVDVDAEYLVRRMLSHFPDFVFSDDAPNSESPLNDWNEATTQSSTAEQSKTRGNTHHTTRCSVPDKELHPAVVAAVSTRKKLKLTQSSFAQCLGVSARTLRDWEQNRRRPSGAAVTLLKWAADRPNYIREIQRAQVREVLLKSLFPG